MGIMTRFKDIMAANFNALLDRAEDPEKMIDQYLRNLEQDMASVKAETASMMAEEKAAKRKVDECQDEMTKMADYAKKAVLAGNDSEAKTFLNKKAELTEKTTILEKSYAMAVANSAKMKEMHDKLEDDIATLKSKRDLLKAKIKVAETQSKINKLGSGVDSAGGNMDAFNQMEDKVNKMMDEADAMAELNQPDEADDIEALTSKYDNKETSVEIEDELAALKAELGM